MLKTFFRKNIKQQQAGFSLIEIITVLFVISIGLTGTITLITQSVQGQNLNKHSLIAYQLAQEGIEIIRAQRDNNWLLKEPDWRLGLENGVYYLDYLNNYPIPAGGEEGHIPTGRLLLNDDGFYESSPANYLPEGQYSRLIFLGPEAEGQMSVRSVIYWYEKNKLKSYTLETELYDWL